MEEKKMSFKEAVSRSPCLGANRYHPGLKALGGYSDKVRCSNTRRFTGSVDLNEIFQDPQQRQTGCVDLYDIFKRDQRGRQMSPWDYGIGLLDGTQEVAIWIEPHPATTREVDLFLKRVEWLKKWLQNNAKDLWELTQRSKDPYRWLATGGVHIIENSPEARQLEQAGISSPREVIELG